MEAKWAATGNAADTGAQKLADVLALTENTVIELLGQLGLQADTAYVTKLVDVIVAILNLSQAPNPAKA